MPLNKGELLKELTEVEKKKIEEEAQKLLEQYEITVQNGVDVIALARKIGFEIGDVELPFDQDGFIISNNKVDTIGGVLSNKIIGLNSQRTPVEKLFIIAHELGHYFLRDNKEEPIYAHREHTHGRSDVENDIDYFAACLLMPSVVFVKEYKYAKYLYGGNKEKIISRLMDLFSVSEESVRRRIIETSEK